MDIRLERFLREQKQLATTHAKILEINPNHPVIISLSKHLDAQADMQDSAFSDVALLLLDQAKIAEGEEIPDPNAFSQRINGFLTKALAA